MEKQIVLIATFILILHLVQAQDQTGFISLDCGLPREGSPYNDSSTELTYTSDDGFVQNGKVGRIQAELENIYDKPVRTLRYFPDGVRNCYNLNVTQDTKYIIKAMFVYGNYDDQNDTPIFDLYLGPNLWATVSENDTIEEMIHLTKSSSLNVCLIKTGQSIPMINALELRPLMKDMYPSKSGSIKYLFRAFLSNVSRSIRYPTDVYDRKWYPFYKRGWESISTNQSLSSNNYLLPKYVMSNGASPLNTSASMDVTWSIDSPTIEIYIYLHFAEFQTSNTREFYVRTWNGGSVYGPYSPTMLKATTINITEPSQCDEGVCRLQVVKTPESDLPPLINAIEAFTDMNFTQLETTGDEVIAIKNILSAYGLSHDSWQGDPCVPKNFSWHGLECDSSNILNPPIITSLDLSSKGLIGTIALAIQKLTHLQELDLSHNNLTGGVPEFLIDMKSLLFINLSGNNLSGLVPQKLLEKKNLKLNIEGNPNLHCEKGSCVNKNEEGGKHKKSMTIPIVALIASALALIVGLIIFCVIRKKTTTNNEVLAPTSSMVALNGRSSEASIITKNRNFTYAQVIEMTNNFERVLGKGGFGIVYYGSVNGTEEVAVKMLSHSSSQGYKQFKAEVELLLRVHHKNLVGLVGYCDEDDKLALIYEYMANGDLDEHMSGKRGDSILSWGTRLKIALESAQGLEYLHNGCKPQMVHRDIKTTNILLNEHFDTKLADFGLSRSFPVEGETHVSTVVAGTIGYLDPEYYRTNWLTEKSDVYSFGIVILVLITNQPVIDQNREKRHIAEWVGLKLTKGDIKSITDQNLHGDYDSNSIWKAIELAMSCLNPSSATRPTMSQVVFELKECLASENTRGGESREMSYSQISREESMTTFGTEANPLAR